MLGAALGIFLIPPIASFFGFTPLSGAQFGLVAAIGAVAIAFISLIIWLIDHRQHAESNG
jgi:hypothetical protein